MRMIVIYIQRYTAD